MRPQCLLNDSMSEDLIRSLFDYLEQDDKIQFILTNTTFTLTFLKSIRRITKSLKTMKLPQTREKILSLVSDPYHQLELTLDDSRRGSYLYEHQFRVVPLLSVNILRCSIVSFTKYYQYSNYQIQELILTLDDRVNRHVLFLAERNNHDSSQNGQQSPLGLKHLSLVAPNFTNHEEEEEEERNQPFPYIPNLISLKLQRIQTCILPSQYNSLTKLTLNSCLFLEDVSAFGNIYDLTLLNCKQIEDISALNNNHRVSICGCSGIKDYSRSFRNSVKITVGLLLPAGIPIPSEYKFPNIDDLHYARELVISNFLITLQSSIPSSLRYLKVWKGPQNLLSFVGLQGLKHLSIRQCESVHSVEGLGSIPILELGYLDNLSSLEGLGKGNRKVALEKCDKIIDFSPLRFVETVEIINCANLKNANEVDHVRYLTLYFIKYDIVCGIKDFSPLENYVQQLRLIFIDSYRWGLEGLQHVPVIDISVAPGQRRKALAQLLKENHQKIIVICVH